MPPSIPEIQPPPAPGQCAGTSRGRPLHVLKFGGTSVGMPDRIRQVVRLTTRAAAQAQVVVVTSAAAGMTDRLLQAASTVGAAHLSAKDWSERIAKEHAALGEQVLTTGGTRARYRVFLRIFTADLHRSLRRIAGKDLTPALRDEVLAAGERLMAPLLALAIEESGTGSVFVDAARLVRTDGAHGEAGVRHGATRRLIRAWHRGLARPVVPVVTGFIGSTAAGATTTLGRGGSDYSAALLASALEADLLVRWTDVDGLYTHDPREHAGAERIEHLPLEQAATWNEAGRLGMHPRALDPLVRAGVPIRVRSTLHPEAPGTFLFISGQPSAVSRQPKEGRLIADSS